MMLLGTYQFSYFPQNLSSSLPVQTLSPVKDFDVEQFFTSIPKGISQIFLNDNWIV